MKKKSIFLILILPLLLIYNTKPKNVILLIGDGMGIGHISAAMYSSNKHLNITKFQHIGFTTTHSLDNLITDSAAAGTAIATGQKTYNNGISVNMQKEPIKTIMEYAKEKGYAFGVVVTSSIVHATPAVFLAHAPHREDYYDLAMDVVEIEPDVAFGGGIEYFKNRPDGIDLIKKLEEKNYRIFYDLSEIKRFRVKDPNQKFIALLAKDGLPPAIKTELNKNLEYYDYLSKRSDYSKSRPKDALEVMTRKALEVFEAKNKPFILMVEGSQIDWASHDNNFSYLLEEMLDFDRAVGVALEFAQKHKETLVIATSDHETGGFTITSGKPDPKKPNQWEFQTKFASTRHTGVLVPVFAHGPGAEVFQGFYDNTDIFKKIKVLWID
ncbi:MAG: alkaline phosphatase [Leptospiraceae bacterium]|nr:alkaline phosphatase [Leptospiraceae bacterium]MDW7976727.1 alkaline phosphatase [Leptospiraceae bacterium]